MGQRSGMPKGTSFSAWGAGGRGCQKLLEVRCAEKWKVTLVGAVPMACGRLQRRVREKDVKRSRGTLEAPSQSRRP